MLTRHASTSEERREYEERVGSAATGSGLNGQWAGLSPGSAEPARAVRRALRRRGGRPRTLPKGTLTLLSGFHWSMAFSSPLISSRSRASSSMPWSSCRNSPPPPSMSPLSSSSLLSGSVSEVTIWRTVSERAYEQWCGV
eukprot:scaffold97773_cov35-Phaeocystis_antarctica.AAC.2